jgi:hypothetical protein
MSARRPRKRTRTARPPPLACLLPDANRRRASHRKQPEMTHRDRAEQKKPLHGNIARRLIREAAPRPELDVSRPRITKGRSGPGFEPARRLSSTKSLRGAARATDSTVRCAPATGTDHTALSHSGRRDPLRASQVFSESRAHRSTARREQGEPIGRPGAASGPLFSTPQGFSSQLGGFERLPASSAEARDSLRTGLRAAQAPTESVVLGCPGT